MRHRILLVDDEELVREYLTCVLFDHGYDCVSFGTCRGALNHLEESGDEVALIVSDIRMPEMNGIQFLSRVRETIPGLPFLLLSGLYDQPLAMDAWRCKATEYLFKPLTETDLVNAVAKYLRNGPVWNEESTRVQVRAFLASASGPGGDVSDRLLPLLDTLGTRRFETLQHSQRVAAFSRLIGSLYGLDGLPLRQLETGALLHDIGKVAIPRNVIDKPGRLTDEEWRLMRLHPSIGASLLSEVPDFEAERTLVLSHHERFNGTGYPYALSGAEIPLSARIFAVSDTLDAICSNRRYRKTGTLASARREIDSVSGTQLDPEIVKCFQATADAEIEAIQRRFAEGENGDPVS